MFRILMALFVAVIAATAAPAQTYPNYDNTYLNDFADLLHPITEEEMMKSLVKNREKTGVETVVVTLPGTDLYPEGWVMEDFATGLFNHWGVGDATRNDGIMILVLPELRAMRIELGAGYDAAWDGVAQDIVNTTFLPAFKEGRFPDGIAKGLTQVLLKIATPKSEGAAPPEAERDLFGIIAMVSMVGIFVVVMLRGFVSDKIASFSKCPSCGQRGLSISRQVTKRATRAYSGNGWKTVSCKHCDWSERNRYTISRLSSSSSSSSFGGGSSSGGGASGRW